MELQSLNDSAKDLRCMKQLFSAPLPTPFPALILALFLPALSVANPVECMVKVNGVTSDTQPLTLQPVEGEPSLIGVLYQDQNAQIVVTDNPFKISINETLGGLVVNSTRSSQFGAFLDLGSKEPSKTLMSTIKKTSYSVTCRK